MSKDRFEKNYLIFENFRPNVNYRELSEKFYSKYDALKANVKNETEEKFLIMIKKRKAMGPRELYEIPVTENQEYGWLCDKAFVYDEDDRSRIYRPRIFDDITKHGVKLLQQKISAKR